MIEREFSFCMFDAQGRYACLDKAVSVGDPATPPGLAEIDQLVVQGVNSIINPRALPASEKPKFIAELAAVLRRRRAETGRPHFVLIEDEQAHALEIMPPPVLIVSSDPELLPAEVRSAVAAVMAAGTGAGERIAALGEVVGLPTPGISRSPGMNEILYWDRSRGVRLLAATALLDKKERGGTSRAA